MRKGIVRGPAVRLVPAGRKLVPKTQRHRKSRTDPDGVLRIPRAQQRAPIHLRWRRIEQETGNRSLQKRLQAGERRLSKLAQRNGFVRLKTLEPSAEFKLMPPPRQRYVILERVQISHDSQVASVIASRQSELRLRIRCRAAPNHYRSHGMSNQKPRNARRSRPPRRLSRDNISCARKSHTRPVHQCGQETPRLLHPRHLFPHLTSF